MLYPSDSTMYMLDKRRGWSIIGSVFLRNFREKFFERKIEKRKSHRSH